jgi:hypothetical protein
MIFVRHEISATSASEKNLPKFHNWLVKKGGGWVGDFNGMALVTIHDVIIFKFCFCGGSVLGMWSLSWGDVVAQLMGMWWLRVGGVPA